MKKNKLKGKGLATWALTLALCGTMAGCQISNTVASAASETDIVECQTDTFLTEREIRNNCDLLGIDYRDINIDSTEMKSNQYNLLVGENTDGELLQRPIIRSNNKIRIVYPNQFPLSVKNALVDVVNEINYIGENIGDPVSYYAVADVDAGTVSQYDIELVYGLDQAYLTKFSYKVLKCDNSKIAVKMVISLNRKKFNILTQDEVSRLLLYEIGAHAVALQEDSYVRENGNLMSSKILGEGKSITDGAKSFTGTDILVRASKYVSNLNSSNVNDIIEFATDYGKISDDKFLEEILDYRYGRSGEQLLTTLSSTVTKKPRYQKSEKYLNDVAEVQTYINQYSQLLDTISIKTEEDLRGETIEDLTLFDTHIFNESENSDAFITIAEDNKSVQIKTFSKAGSFKTSVDTSSMEFTNVSLDSNGISAYYNGKIVVAKKVGDYLILFFSDCGNIDSLQLEIVGKILTKSEYEKKLASDYDELYSYIAQKNKIDGYFK